MALLGLVVRHEVPTADQHSENSLHILVNELFDYPPMSRSQQSQETARREELAGSRRNEEQLPSSNFRREHGNETE